MAKVPLDVIEEPPGAVPFRGQQPAAVLQAPLGPAGDGAEEMEIGEQRVGRGGLRPQARRRPVRGHPQHQQRVGEDQVAGHHWSVDVVLIEVANLPAAESMRGNRVGEAHAVGGVGARQRYEIFHRGVRHDLTGPDVLLHAIGERADETEAPRHPAHAPVEPPCERVQGEPVILVQRVQQPGLLKRARGRIGLQEMAQDQGVAFRQVPADGHDRIAVQAMQTADSFVAIDHHVDRRGGHDDDRELLAGVG